MDPEIMEHDFLAIQKHLVASDVIFHKWLNEIMEHSRIFVSIASEHDVNDRFKMNGYRSMIEFTKQYFAKIRKELETSADSPDLKQYRKAAATLISLMRLMLQIHEKAISGKEDALEDFSALLRFTEQDVEPFHSSIRGFYLRPGLRNLMNGFVMRIILTNISIYNLGSILSRQESRLFSALSLNGSIEHVRHLWGPAEFGLIRAVNCLKFLISRGYMEHFSCPRQSKFVINSEGKIGGRSDAGSLTDEDEISIAYLTNQKKGVSPQDSLIFHCHGGGYISSSFRSHEVYLREWGRKLLVPIACVNYRLCPEHPYPASLQDLLDAYLFLTSGSAEARAKIGFRPNKIIVTGDSAGGNLALALVLALNEIRGSDPQVVLPVAIALQYPNGNPAVDSSCSRAMSLIDTTITISGLGHAAGSYFGAHHQTSESWFRSQSYEEIALSMMRKMKTDHLYNPLISSHFTDLANVKLFILAAEFDPLIDDAVAIGRVWRGPLVMDLARGLPHSFMSYAGVPDVSDAMDVAISRIAEGLGLSVLGCTADDVKTNKTLQL